jgi:DNA (cytosine-5)-methyltransferase 1
MIAASLFSGIGAPEQAMPEWDWRYCAEVEPFARTVLKARHPQTKNLGDVNGEDIATRALDLGRASVIVFGTPCQSFSVAGRRLGMDDPRGNMALVALGVLARTQPRWFVFENVTGLLSVDDGRGFGVLLRAMDELGYSCCWSSLDSQWFGVAQRRERLFVVGYLGTEWRRPAAVLFESEGVRGHSPPRRQAGETVAGTVEARANAGGAGWGTDFLAGGGLTVDEVVGAVSSKWSKRTGGPAGDECYNLIADPITANEGRTYTHEGRNNFRLHNVMAFAENSRAEVRLEDGDGSTAASLKARGGKPGQGYPAIVEEQDAATSKADAAETLRTLRATVGTEAFSEWGLGILDCFQSPQILQSFLHGKGIRRAASEAGSAIHDGTLARAEDLPAGTLRSLWQDGPDGRSPQGRELAQQLAKQFGKTLSFLSHQRSSVRRLTPKEVERLMGFPDDYTLVRYHGKQATDGPRYRVLGNSMVVPVMQWILKRIEAVDAL